MTVRLVRTVDIAAIASTAGFDSVYIDLSTVASPWKPRVRSAWPATLGATRPRSRPDPSFIARVMDSGAMGIIARRESGPTRRAQRSVR